MEIYIAWSGERGEALARILQRWLPRVIQAIKPFFSPNNIEKGTRWNTEIARQLESSQVGLIVLTPESKTSPWILFEAGALSKSITEGRVIPILFDLKTSDVDFPLAQFQNLQFSHDLIYKMMIDINNWFGEGALAEGVLTDAFEQFWPRLELEVREVLSKPVQVSEGKDFNLESAIRELLELSRLNAALLDEVAFTTETLLPPPPSPKQRYIEKHATPKEDLGPCPFEVGSSVRHPKFGKGVVMSASQLPAGNDWEFSVSFSRDVGTKRLVHKLAKLEAVED